MMRSIILAAAVTMTLAVPAIAQTNSANQNSNPTATSPTSGQGQNQNTSPTALRQQVQQNLSKAGFSDIKIMPESFLVRAKDPNGNPIMMVINPDSVAAVTYAPNSTNNSNRTGNSDSSSNRSSR